MEHLATSSIGKLEVFLTWLSNPTTQLLWLPLLGCIFIMATPKAQQRLIKTWAVIFSGLSLLAAVLMVSGLPKAIQDAGIQIASDYVWHPFAKHLPFRQGEAFSYVQNYSWMKVELGEYWSFNVNYFVGVDGLSLPLIVMSAAVIFLAVIWALPRTERVRDFFALTLLMEVGLLGVFVALDYVLFYLFWELMLIPMYFLIAGWGRDPEKAGRAAIKFFIYTMFGSVFMLIAFIAMQVMSNVYSFSIIGLTEFELTGGQNLPMLFRQLMFIGLLLGFAVKVPMFPFHTWLPDAHTEAPTEMSVILAAVMLKTGSYAYLRILYPSFPDVAYQLGPIIAFCGVAAIVYGAAITLVQKDIKRLVAYSSISHMGFIVLGISAMNPDATVGAIFHMVAHGVIIATLFFMCGVIERRYGTRDLYEVSGLLAGAPSYVLPLGIAAFAGMGLPGLAGFWGEFLVLKGTFYNSPNWMSVHVGAIDASRYLQIVAAIAVIGILTAAVYMINLLQRVLPGPVKANLAVWRGFRLTDGLALVPLALAVIVLGLYPAPIINACEYYAHALWATALRF
ncbi:NADH-quinone oxidoreductase subunit M [bacterium]|nr:NADH-quinone oxidoreductase subunit M [bacterium]